MSDVVAAGSAKGVLRSIEAFITDRGLDDAAKLDKIHAFVKAELSRLAGGKGDRRDLATPEGFRRALEGDPL